MNDLIQSLFGTDLKSALFVILNLIFIFIQFEKRQNVLKYSNKDFHFCIFFLGASTGINANGLNPINP
jgi:hypothetical protein